MKAKVSGLLAEFRDWMDAIGGCFARDYKTQYVQRLVLCNFVQDFDACGWDLVYDVMPTGRIVWYVFPRKGVVA